MKMTRWLCLLGVALSVSLVLGCGGSEPAEGGGDKSGKSAGGKLVVSPAARVEAHKVFKTICTPCHGEDGHGNGPAAVAMDPKPRTFSDPEWQDSVTDEHIKKVIVYGGAAVGKSAAMTGQPQLKGKDEVLQALCNRIRRFKAK